MAVIPVPTRRSSELLVSQRLLNQIRNDQLDLLRIQDRLSTGRRISQPSDDSAAAVRASQLQLRLEQKEQVNTNLQATQSFLAATEASVASVSSTIREIRGLAVSISGSTTSDTEREAAAIEIRRAIDQLVATGNGEFRNRFLFGGSQTNESPLAQVNNFVSFHGNASNLRSFVDVDLLLDANITAQETFGVVSEGVRGEVDLDPVLTEQTLLQDLNGGAGIREGSFVISDGAGETRVDISGTRTIADVIRRIESNPPPGRQVTVRIDHQSLRIQLTDGIGTGNLSIREIGGGTTATVLGIRNELGVGLGTLVGDDLDPVLKPTTPLRDITGVRASALLQSSGLNNDILLEAADRGDGSDGITVQLVDDELLRAGPALFPGLETARFEATATAASGSLALPGTNNNLILTANTPGAAFNDVTFEIVNAGAIGNAATINYDAGTKRLQIGIDSGDQTDVQTVVNAINASSPFTATHDPSDVADGAFVSTATVPTSAAGVTFGTTGSSGGEANTVFVNIRSGASTAAQVVDAINSAADVTAVLTATLDPKDKLDGQQLGFGQVTAGVSASLQNGAGAELDLSSGIQVINGGETHVLRFDEADSVQDLLNIINGAGIHLLAEIADDGRGIDIRTTLSGADLHIGENGGTTATQLGIRSFHAQTKLADLNHGLGVDTLAGKDFTIRRNDGVELEIDVSGVDDIQGVLDVINTHPSNLDPLLRVEARIPEFGNGIELVDSTAEGNSNLTILKGPSGAAWDLGFIPRGVFEIDGSTGESAIGSAVEINFPEPNHLNTTFRIEGAIAGPHLDGVDVEFINSGAVTGDAASVVFDSATDRLVIDIDPLATTINTVVAQISAEGTFGADLVTDDDLTNDGTSLVPTLGIVGTTSGGISNTAAEAAELAITFPSPFDTNTAIVVEALNPGVGYNDVRVDFVNTGAVTGNAAQVSYDSVGKVLTVDIDTTAATAQTVISAFETQALFGARLDTTTPNDGSGVIGFTGTSGSLADGTAEILRASDVNPIEVNGLFNSLSRLATAVEAFDIRQIERAVASLDEDFQRVNFSRAEIGTRQQFLSIVESRGQDEEVELRRVLSLEIDTDIVKAISDLSARQASVEASLRLIGQTFQLSLLDFV